MMDTPTSPPNSGNAQVEVIIEQPSSNINQKLERSNVGLNDKLQRLSPVQPQHTIHKVYNELRNAKKEAYEPNLIAIGPYHSHNEYLKKMEVHKLRYLQSFLDREKKSIDDCVSALESLESKARYCYAESVSLSSMEFIEMLVLDGCFIIEFALRCNDPSLRNPNDVIFDMTWVAPSVRRDLLLLENQVPFFILCELYNFRVHDDEITHQKLAETLLKIYGFNFPLKVDCIETPTDIKHLLELIHKFLVHEYEDQEPKETHVRNDGEHLHLISSATVLAESNVRFKRSNQDVSLFRLDFKNGSMWLPQLVVTDQTESNFRNLIAYEQYFLDDTKRCHASDHATLMGCLINSAEDVKLLMERGIIVNWLGSEEDVANVFNKLGDGVTRCEDRFIYVTQFEKVNEHCNRPWNKWIATLKHNHFNSPWAILSIIAALVLLALTDVQTVLAIMNY